MAKAILTFEKMTEIGRKYIKEGFSPEQVTGSMVRNCFDHEVPSQTTVTKVLNQWRLYEAEEARKKELAKKIISDNFNSMLIDEVTRNVDAAVKYEVKKNEINLLHSKEAEEALEKIEKQKEQTTERLTEAISAAATDKEKFKVEIAVSNSKIEALKTRTAEFKTQVEDLLKKIDSLHIDNEHLVRENAQQESEQNRMLTELEQTRTDLATRSDELYRVFAEKNTLEKELAVLGEKMNEAENKIKASAKDEAVLKEAQQAKINAEIIAEKQAGKTATAENSIKHLQNDIERLEKELTWTREELEDLKNSKAKVRKNSNQEI